MSYPKNLILHLVSEDDHSIQRRRIDNSDTYLTDNLSVITSSFPPSATTLINLQSHCLESIDIHLHETSLYDSLSLASMTHYLGCHGNEGRVYIYVYDGSAYVHDTVRTSIILAGLQSKPKGKEEDDNNTTHCKVFRARRSSKNIGVSNNNNIVDFCLGDTFTSLSSVVSPILLGIGGSHLLGTTGGDDLVDEDELLTNGLISSNYIIPDGRIESNTSHCIGRKACENCICGRGKNDDSDKNTNVLTTLTASSCGRCHKGDAYRCASCPYLGKPAFKVGEEHLVLELTDDL